jgi:glutamate/tyrosine decarboxylase-like PLP-dependent enzyme
MQGMQPRDQLSLSPAEMRDLGYRVVDMLVDHFERLPEKPVTRRGRRPDLEERLREPLPETGMDAAALLDQVQQDILTNIMHVDHPRFLAFVPGPSNYVGALADALASGFNVFAGTWLEASGPTEIELVVLDWLREACGLAEAAGGLFVSGGSMANITALAVARHIKLDDQIANATVYCSDQAHSCIERGLKVIGFQPGQLRKVPSDDRFRLNLLALRSEVEADRARGQRPFCVVASAGTTNTGAVDPLRELAEYCRREGMWLHVDGAYGAATALCPRGRQLLDGLGDADSLALDPHKWLFQPYEIGCVLVRDMHWLRQAFHILPEYLADIEGQEGEVNLCDYGIQLTRGFRALKLWMSLKVFGQAAFGRAQERGFELAELAEEVVGEMPGWQVVTPAQMGVITFRYAPQGLSNEELDRLQTALVEALMADGFAMVSSTVLRGRTVLRLCTINPRTTEEDIRETLAGLGRMGQEIIAERPGGPGQRHETRGA